MNSSENSGATSPLAVGTGSARDRIARALALEYYRGEYRVRVDNQAWLTNATGAMTVGTILAAQYAEERAQECTLLFWKHWIADADTLLPNVQGEPRPLGAVGSDVWLGSFFWRNK